MRARTAPDPADVEQQRLFRLQEERWKREALLSPDPLTGLRLSPTEPSRPYSLLVAWVSTSDMELRAMLERPGVLLTGPTSEVERRVTDAVLGRLKSGGSPEAVAILAEEVLGASVGAADARAEVGGLLTQVATLIEQFVGAPGQARFAQRV